MLNILFIFMIVLSFAAYFYYKTKQFHSTLPIRKKWYKARSGVALGVFIIAFGLNTCIVYPTLVGFLIAAVFIIVGFIETLTSYKRARHEGRFIKEEYELNN